MTQTTVKTHDHFNLYYHPELKAVHHELKADIDGESIREVLMAGVDLLKQHSADKWLSDNREFVSLDEEANNWINTVWINAAIDAGWKYWALVVPDVISARAAMNEYIRVFAQNKVTIYLFSTPEEALVWLENPEEMPD